MPYQFFKKSTELVRMSFGPLLSSSKLDDATYMNYPLSLSFFFQNDGEVGHVFVCCASPLRSRRGSNHASNHVFFVDEKNVENEAYV
jgi:hypothetical protein